MTSPFDVETEESTTYKVTYTFVEAPALPDTFTVDVTDEDIQLGSRDAFGCPIQRAATRHLFLNHGFHGRLVVGMKSANVNREMDTYYHDGLLFIAKFDSHIPVEPCRVTFTRR